MRKLSSIYQEYRDKKHGIKQICPDRYMRRAGYGYIKRRVGLLSSEVDGPCSLMIKNFKAH